jgi:hypothetical protein
MNPWTPYLIDVLGDNERGRVKVNEAEGLIRAFQSTRLSTADLIGLVDWLEKLDIFRQIFILPTVIRLLPFPSRALRFRILRFAGELVGETSAPLILKLKKLITSDEDLPGKLVEVLREVVKNLDLKPSNDSVSTVADLATLLDERLSIFGLSLLEGLYRWLEAQPEKQQLNRTFVDFFADDSNRILMDDVFISLSKGSPFVREMIVRWLGFASPDFSSGASAKQLLLVSYGRDPAAPVAASAIIAFAGLVQPSEVAATTSLLEAELRTFRLRRASLAESSVSPRFEAARLLSSSVLRALGLLARNHPAAEEPRQALYRIVTALPSERLDLSEVVDQEDQAGIFEGALALQGAAPFFRVWGIRRVQDRLEGFVGHQNRVALEEPRRSLDRNAESYWCQLAIDGAGSACTFRLVEPFRGGLPVATDLLGLIAPRIKSILRNQGARMATRALQGDCMRELENRAPWSSAAFEAISEILRLNPMTLAGTPGEESAEVNRFLNFLVETAEAVEQFDFKKREDADARNLRNRIRATLLNHFAEPKFFEWLFAHEEVDQVRAKLLTSVADSAMRSVDTAISYRWISCNVELLRLIAISPNHKLYERATAAAVLRFRLRPRGTKADEENILIDHQSEVLNAGALRALPFISDDRLLDFFARLDRHADHALLKSRPENVPEVHQQIEVRSELVARAWEGGRRWNSVDDEIAICLAAATSGKRTLLSDTARRRLIVAFFDARPERRNGPARRLFEQVLRTATGAVLEAANRLAERREDPQLSMYLGLLMERRLADLVDTRRAVAGSHFDDQTIADVSVRRAAQLSFLCRLSRQDTAFASGFLSRRVNRKQGREAETVVAAAGAVRQIGVLPGSIVLAELKPIPVTSASRNLAELAAGLVPAFVHHPRGHSDVRCLATLQRVGPAAVDFHLPATSSGERKLFLEDLLAENKSVRLVGWVTGEGARNRKMVDIGVSLPGVPISNALEVNRELGLGDAVVVQIRRENERNVLEVVSARSGLEAGQRVLGFLHSRKQANGRRAWYAAVGDVQLEIPRRELTSDLCRLFELDDLQDRAPFLVRLKEAPVRLRVLLGRSASLLQAEPIWQLEELMIAVASGLVDRVSVVRIDEQHPPGIVVEIEAGTALARDLGDGPVLSLGTLAYLRPGDLFDPWGEPVAFQGMKAGLRLALAVAEAGADASGATGRPLPLIHLRMTEAADERNLDLEALFTEAQTIWVRQSVESAGNLHLSESLSSVPPPRIELSDSREQKFFPSGVLVEAVVSQKWDPWSLEYRLSIRYPHTRYLGIGPSSMAEDLSTFLDLRRGDLIPKSCKFDFFKERLVCRTAGLQIPVDWLTFYLLPKPHDIKPDQIRSSILLTEASRAYKRTNQKHFSDGFREWFPAVEAVRGLVTSIPAKDSESKQVGVHWVGRVQKAGEGGAQANDYRQDTLRPTEEYHLGDVLAVREENGDLVVDRRRQFLSGTFLYKSIAARTWMQSAHRESRERVEGVLLRPPESGNGCWLFCLEPAELVEVSPESLREAERLNSLQPLDRATFQLIREIDGANWLGVESTAEGILARSRGSLCELQVFYHERATDLFRCRLSGKFFDQAYPLELQLSGTDLPTDQKIEELHLKVLDKKLPVIPCTVESFHLNTWQENNRYRFELGVTLGRFESTHIVKPKMIRPPLSRALESRGRIDGARGTIVDRDGNLAVVLSWFSHPVPLPLPLKEQTWLPFTGKLPKVGQTFDFTILLGLDGLPFASLRRVPPRSLADWLEFKRYLTASPRLERSLLYVGSPSGAQPEEGGLRPAGIAASNGEEPEDWVLFEAGPGETIEARARQIRFLGGVFHSRTLHAGDEITKIQIAGRIRTGLGSGDPILDILDFTLDIVEDLDLSKNDSTLFGSVKIVGNEAKIVELRGVSRSRKPVDEGRVGRWRRVLSGISAAYFEELGKHRDGKVVYLKFLGADVESGELFFELATREEIFAINKLVYIRTGQVSDYGESWKLEVFPLDEDVEGDYFIPDNLFSVRKGQLHRHDWQRESIRLLARVIEEPRPGALRGTRGSSFKLSLVDSPPRPFRFLMSRSEWQVIVKERSPDGLSLSVEAGIGTNVQVPLQHLDFAVPGESAAAGTGPARVPRAGDILFLERVLEENRLMVRDLLPGNINYLPATRRPIVLTRLWGNQKYRQGKLNANQPVECTVVGLPQLTAHSRIQAGNLSFEGSLPQRVMIAAQDNGYVLVTDNLGSGDFVVGSLSFDQDHQPHFENTLGDRRRLSWRDVSFREGSPREIAFAVASWHWKDVAADHPCSVSDSWLIAAEPAGRGAASLTGMAEHPFPVDHLVEQFGANPQPAPVLELVVAGTGHGRIVFEIAPGRYAELPTALIAPFHGTAEDLIQGNVVSWSRLAGGDEVLLEALPGKDHDEFLPRFRILDVAARYGRQLGSKVAVQVCVRADGNIVLGTLRGPGIQSPDLAPLLAKESFHDLNQHSRPDRLGVLVRLFDAFGQRLVLEGEVVGSKDVTGGALYFIDIGISIPLKNGRSGEPACFVPADESPMAPNERVGIRVVAIAFDGPLLARFDFELERPPIRLLRRTAVRGTGAAFVRANRPEVGDSVLLYRPDGGARGSVVVCGFEHLELFWVATEGDDLHLEDPVARAEVLEILLADGGSLWATCEAVGDRRVTLSRKVQLAQVLPGAGEVVRARVVKFLGRERWLAYLFEVPIVLLSRQLFRGPTVGEEQIGEAYAKSAQGGFQVEVVPEQDGRLTANQVYRLPPGEETTIEVVVDSGILVMKGGCRIFVPKRELTWCGELGSKALRSLFQPGDRLRVARVGREDLWSHVATYDIRTEVAEIVRNQGAVSVTVALVEAERAIVRSSSGALLELNGDQQVEPGTRLVAFVQDVDLAGRLIRLSLEEIPRRRWNFPEITEGRWHRSPVVSQGAFLLLLNDLETTLAKKGNVTGYSWAGRHPDLETDPETVRVILDTIGPDSKRLFDPGEGVDLEKETSLQRLLRQLAEVERGAAEIRLPNVDETFALSFRLLQHGRTDEAMRHLKNLAGSRPATQSFAFSLSLVVAYARTGENELAAANSRALFDRLWANAVRTMVLPSIEPPSFDPQDNVRSRWEDALAAGNLEELADIVANQPVDFESSSAGLVFYVWRFIVEGRLDGFSELVDRFFDALHQDLEESAENLDERVFVMAAFLEFSRGNVVEAWNWLDRISEENPELAVPAFWRSHLQGKFGKGENLDPVLVAAAALQRESRWRNDVNLSLLEELWRSFRESRHRWYLDLPVCKALTPLPARDSSSLRRWAKLNGIETGLDALIGELDDNSTVSTSAGN